MLPSYPDLIIFGRPRGLVDGQGDRCGRSEPPVAMSENGAEAYARYADESLGEEERAGLGR